MLALLATSANGFAPAAAPMLAPVRAPAAVTMGIENELGATGPLLPYWDPLGMVN
jgi:hypothetical protein